MAGDFVIAASQNQFLLPLGEKKPGLGRPAYSLFGSRQKLGR